MPDLKKVIMVGMIEPFSGDTDGAEIWGVNRTYTVQKDPPLDRLYFFDNPGAFVPSFADDLNALKIPIYCREAYPQITKSEKYPIESVMKFFNGVKYFTCTPAYMLAHAIAEGFTEIILQGMYYFGDSMEYLNAKPCMDFWVGLAMGKGCTVSMGQGTAICQPMPWEPGLYGYYMNMNGEICRSTLSAAYKACLQYPRCIVPNDEEIGAALEGRRKVITEEAARNHQQQEEVLGTKTMETAEAPA